MSIVRRGRFVKPPLGVQPDFSHHLMRGPQGQIPAGLWLMNEGAGSRLIDLSPNKNNGVLTNFAYTPASGWAGGRRGPALSVDGVDDRADIPDSPIWSGGSQQTWRTLIYPTVSDAGERTWLMKGEYRLLGWSYGIQFAPTFGKVRVFIASTVTDDGSNFFDTTNVVVTINTWNDVVVVYDGNQDNSNRIKVYVNGTNVAGATTGTIATTLQDSSPPLRIGEFTGLGRRFQGLIDDVRILPWVLSPDAIAELARVEYAEFLWPVARRYFVPAAVGVLPYQPWMQRAPVLAQ